VTSRDLFLLDPEVVYLNHGSFGACPRPVFDVYQEWQRRIEREPITLLARRLDEELSLVRTVLGAYLGARPDDLVLVPNATAGMNAVLRSLRLEPGDELLTTEHEYGAISLLLDFVSARTGARVVRRPGVNAEAIWGGASERTKALVVSHVTSPTALVLPVAELCALARDAGVLSVVDGAHGPGQISLDLEQLGADFYTGNCHKWLCSPKGAGFLHARPERQALLDPPIAGWGWRESAFSLRNGPQGTSDPSSYLTVPAAIEFAREHGDAPACRELLREASRRLAAAGFEPFAVDQPLQMACFGLPESDPERVELRLLEEFRIEVPVRRWNGQILIRVSIGPYNAAGDVEALVVALQELFRPLCI
jgi:isopenicillin-N epimerase